MMPSTPADGAALTLGLKSSWLSSCVVKCRAVARPPAKDARQAGCRRAGAVAAAAAAASGNVPHRRAAARTGHLHVALQAGTAWQT